MKPPLVINSTVIVNTFLGQGILFILALKKQTKQKCDRCLDNSNYLKACLEHLVCFLYDFINSFQNKKKFTSTRNTQGSRESHCHK